MILDLLIFVKWKKSPHFLAFGWNNLFVRNHLLNFELCATYRQRIQTFAGYLRKNTDLRLYHLYADAELCARTIDPCQWIYSPHIIIIFQSGCLATTTEAAESVCTFINIYLTSTTKIRVFKEQYRLANLKFLGHGGLG